MSLSLTTMSTTAFNSLTMAESSCLLSLPSLFYAKNKSSSLSIPSKPLTVQIPRSNSSLFPLTTTKTTRYSSLLTFVAQTSDWAQEEETPWENQSDPTWGTGEGDSEGAKDEVFGGGGFAEQAEEVKIFVGNLPFDVDSEKLASLFEQAGTVEVAEVSGLLLLFM